MSERQAYVKKHFLPLVCPQCKRTYNPTRKWQKFCSEDCRRDFHSAAQKAVHANLRAFKDERLKDVVAVQVPPTNPLEQF